MTSWLAAILAWIASLFTLPVDLEAARCAAAVHVAAASMQAGESPTPPSPTPPAPKPDTCQQCNGTGWIVHADGHRTPCPCGIQPQIKRGAR